VNESASPAVVLVVDDDRAIRESLERLLAMQGHRVLTAGTGVPSS
jgi:DNA-binding response OmpR family regulator